MPEPTIEASKVLLTVGPLANNGLVGRTPARGPGSNELLPAGKFWTKEVENGPAVRKAVINSNGVF